MLQKQQARRKRAFAQFETICGDDVKRFRIKAVDSKLAHHC
jgi:hypothetical protein